MTHLVRNFSDLRVISGSLYDLPPLLALLLGDNHQVCVKRGDPQGKGTSLFSTLKVGRTEIRRKATRPEPVSREVLKYQRENKMSSDAREFYRQADDKLERENEVGLKVLVESIPLTVLHCPLMDQTRV